MSTASTSVSKTESPGSNPCAPATLSCCCNVHRVRDVYWRRGGISKKAEGG